MKKLLVLGATILLTNGCSSGDSDSGTVSGNTNSNTSNQNTLSHTSTKFNPYGVFFGELASDGDSKNIIMHIDDSTDLAYVNFYDFIAVGEYGSKGSNQYQADKLSRFNVDEDSVIDFVFRGGADPMRESKDYIFSYTFDEFGQDFKWSIVNGSNVTVELPDLDGQVASLITRTPAIPARYSIISGQYVLQLDGALLPSYTLTIDLLESGGITGVDSKGCVISGNYNIGNTHVNVYPVNMSISNCDISGSYTGLISAMGIEDSQSRALLMHLHNPINALSIAISRN